MSPDRRNFLTGAAAAVVAASGLTALGAGNAATAAPGQAARTPDPDAPKHELRGMWIASVVNIDWPSAPGLSAAAQQAELIALYDLAVARGLNTVVLQVRPTADAFWPSPYEPWSKYLTGTQGEDPGYDPLGFAVRAAHERNLSLHAWFNPYRVSMDTNVDALLPTHPARMHPDWVIPYGGKLYYDPGVPAAREFSVRAILDAVQRYDLDGVHFDDYFYPYPVAGQSFADDATYATYGGRFADKATWRRDNINTLIRHLVTGIRRTKPHVQFGVSPFAVWRNVGTDPLGSDTQAGAQTYDDLYADTRRWVREEWIDYLAPQVYWAIGLPVADYAKIVDWWARQVRESGSRVRLYIGEATYKVGASTQSPAWNNDPAELSNHLALDRRYPELSGNIFFSAVSVRDDLLGATTLLQHDRYQHPALVPTMPWLDRRAPRPVDSVRVTTAQDALRVTWTLRSHDARGFAVYRFDGHGRPSAADYADATHLVASIAAPVAGARTASWTDTTATPAHHYTYAVRAVDALGNESTSALERC
jgi:uncharacterized lipoprotein YddW (UPF0748 family)